MNDIQARVSAELTKPIPDSPDGLKQAAIALESVRHELLLARTSAQRTLAEKRAQYRHPVPEKGEPRLTDFDRTIMLEGDTAQYSQSFQELSGLETLVSERLAFIRELLM